jgi:hypothetical protein
MVYLSTSVPASTQAKSVAHMIAPEPPADWQAVYDDSNKLLKTFTTMNYVSPATVKATLKRNPDGFDSSTYGAAWQEHAVWVENGRGKHFALHRNGFELVDHDPIRSKKDIDFLSKDDVLDNYYPHCEQLLERYLGNSSSAVKVKAFDHNVRKQVGETVQKPAGVVHGDYTSVSGPRRLQLLGEPPKINDVWRERLGAEQQPLVDPSIVQECIQGKRRYALINVWRNIDPENPVQAMPLGCIDATTHSDKDLRVLELQYQDRIGENYIVCPSESHRWVYFPEMVYEEALLIKQWDSAGDFAQTKERSDDQLLSTFAIHSAFQDPTTPTTAPPRQSIEVRCVAIWEPDDESSTS